MIKMGPMLQFGDEDSFCTECFLHESFWPGDTCPECGCEYIINYKHLGKWERVLAVAKYMNGMQK